MKNKRLLTLDDLVKFCKDEKFQTFDCHKTGYKLSVRSPAEYNLSERSDDYTLFGKVKVFHTGRNRNGSNVTFEAAQKVLPSIKYKPVLANFCEIDGVKDFTSHDVAVGDNGELSYIERQVGCFTADEPILEYDKETDRHYAYAYIAIPREYTDAAEIIERKKGTKVSVELDINSMTYDSANDELILEDIELTGLTLLGKDPKTGKDVEEGMEGARVDIADFSEENNKARFEQNEKLIEVLEKVNETISVFNIQTTKKEGGANVVKEEKTDKAKENESISANSENTPEDGNKIVYSIGGKDFAVSLDKIQTIISTLVNTNYGQDGTFYSTIVYPSNVVMIDTWSNKAYRQDYQEIDGVFNLVGERVPVEAHWLTKEEALKLEEKLEHYSAVTEKLAKYEEEPDKMDVLNSEDYKQVFELDEFKALREDHFDMSVEEVKKKADDILLKFAKSGNLKFSKEDDVSIFSSKRFGSKEYENSRYGNLFNKE